MAFTEETRERALQIVGIGIAEIVGNYSENALLINACYLAADRYTHLKTTNGLSTTRNIPEPLRLDSEIDVVYTNEDLVRNYQTEVITVVLKNYVVVSVSLVDAVMEELYEYLLKVCDPAITEANVEKMVRNAWTNNNLVNFLTDPQRMNLRNPRHLQTEFAEAFLRYGELRIVRHTLLHTNGILSAKNGQKLQDYLALTPDDRKHMALANAPFFDEQRKIVLTINDVLSIRQYLDRFLMFVYRSIQEREVVEEKAKA